VRGAPPLAVSGPRIRGKVRVNDEPVFGAVAWKGATRSGQAVLDAQGTFEARNVELGDVELQAVKLQTRKVVYGSLFDGDVARVTVAEDADAQHDFDLKSEMVRMEGRVQTASGKPCAKTTVSVGERERDTKASAVTDEQGAFSLSLPKLAGPWRAVAAWGPELFEKSVEAPGAALVLEVPDLGRGLARFVDRRTRAEIIPASVSWRRAGETRFQLRDLTFDAPVEDERWYPFQIPYGEFELVAWTPRPGYAPAPLSKLAWKEGDPEPRMVFELEQGIAVDFALASDSAAPSSDDRERVWLLEASPAFFGDVGPPWTREDVQLPTYADRTRRVSFDAQGRARIAGLRTGKHRFVSFSPSLRVEPAEIEITAENQRFEVRIVRAP
jgi:hypothetical protein